MAALGSLSQLVDVDLTGLAWTRRSPSPAPGNAVTEVAGYRLAMLRLRPSLATLDGLAVTADERVVAALPQPRDDDDDHSHRAADDAGIKL